VNIKSTSYNYPANSSEGYTNSLSVPVKWTFHRGETVNNTFTWSVTTGLKLTGKLSWWIFIPILGPHISIQMTLDFSGTAAQTTSKIATYDYSLEIPVPPHTRVVENFYIKETNQEYEWETDILFHGCSAVWFKSRIDNYNLHWHPVHMIFKNAEGFTCWTETEDENDENFCKKSFCKYRSKGMYAGLVQSQSDHNNSEEPVGLISQ
jgi:hypothetical protein